MLGVCCPQGQHSGSPPAQFPSQRHTVCLVPQEGGSSYKPIGRAVAPCRSRLLGRGDGEEANGAGASSGAGAAPAQHPDPGWPLTVLLGQLYFSKTSCTRSSPPSVNIMIILLQLARVMLDCGADTAPEATPAASSAGHRAACSQEGWPQPTPFPSPFLWGEGDQAEWAGGTLGMMLWLMPLHT